MDVHQVGLDPIHVVLATKFNKDRLVGKKDTLLSRQKKVHRTVEEQFSSPSLVLTCRTLRKVRKN